MISSHGASITVNDHSFETNAGIPDPATWSNDISPDWQGRDGQNDGDAFEERIAGFSSEGLNHVGMNVGYYVWQDTGVALQPNTTYTLSISAGYRAGQTAAVNSTAYGLIAGGNNLGAATLADTAAVLADAETIASAQWDAAANITATGFGEAPDLTYTTGAVVPGGNLVIFLGDNSASGRSHFDNIRLDASPAVPEPSTSLLAGLAGLALVMRRRK